MLVTGDQNCTCTRHSVSFYSLLSNTFKARNWQEANANTAIKKCFDSLIKSLSDKGIREDTGLSRN